MDLRIMGLQAQEKLVLGYKFKFNMKVNDGQYRFLYVRYLEFSFGRRVGRMEKLEKERLQKFF